MCERVGVLPWLREKKGPESSREGTIALGPCKYQRKLEWGSDSLGQIQTHQGRYKMLAAIKQKQKSGIFLSLVPMPRASLV